MTGRAGPFLERPAGFGGRLRGGSRAAGHRGQQHVLLGRRGGLGDGHPGVEWRLAVVVEHAADAGQLVSGRVPGRHDGQVEVVRLGQEGALEVARQPGVPAQLEGAEQGVLVAEGLADAGHVGRQQAVASRVGGVDHVAEHVTATVEGGPGHGHLLSPEALCLRRTYSGYVLRVCKRPSVCKFRA